MTWLLLALCCAAFVEAVVRLDLSGQVRNAARVTRKIAAVVRSARISDHWKEKALSIYAGKLLSSSLRLLLTLLAAAAPAVLLAALTGWSSSPSVQLISSWAGLPAATIIAVVYAAARSRFAGG